MKAQSLAENIAQKLEELIIVGTYLEGDRLPEVKLAQQLDVSRSTIREALLLLQRRHLIKINPNCGAVVATITPSDVFFLGKMAKVLIGCAIEDVTRKPWTQKQRSNFKNLVESINLAGEESDTLKVYGHIFEFISYGLNFSKSQGNHYLIQTLANILPCLRRDLYRSFQLKPNQTLDKAIICVNEMYRYASTQDTQQAQAQLNDLIDHLMSILSSALKESQLEVH